MLIRTHDPDAINALANHEEIRPFIGGSGPLDFTDAIARPEHHFIIGQHGGFALIWTAPAALEVHTMIMKKGRGRWARDAASFGIGYARQAGAKTLWTKVPPHSRNVRIYAAMMGMRDMAMTVEQFGLPYDVMAMEI